MTIVLLRCTALPADIDGAAGIRQHGFTDALLDTFSSKLLWDEYGINAEIIPFMRDFPHADIHELISLDLLHQAIKGTFKDHLVDWIGEYLEITYEKAEAERILDEIDQWYAFDLSWFYSFLISISSRLAATPAFPELRKFKQGHWFKQWTGDDLKVLTKVNLSIYKFVILLCSNIQKRFIYLLFTACSLLMPSSAFPHFWTFATLPNTRTLTPQHSKH